jgi:hypothetical protein
MARRSASLRASTADEECRSRLANSDLCSSRMEGSEKCGVFRCFGLSKKKVVTLWTGAQNAVYSPSVFLVYCKAVDTSSLIDIRKEEEACCAYSRFPSPSFLSWFLLFFFFARFFF